MPKFRSPLGEQQFAGQPLMEFDVPDESESFAEPQYPERPPAMRPRGPVSYGNPAPPVDMGAVMAFQNKLDGESIEDSLEVERQIREAKEARRTGKEKLSSGARRRIEILIGMTRDTRKADVNGTSYVLQTLKSKELRESIMAASAFDGDVQFPFELRKQMVARSLVQVAEVDIDQFVGSSSLEAKLQMVDDLPEPLLNRLYSEYNILAKESQDKYAIKSAEDAQEVAEDLKK